MGLEKFWNKIKLFKEGLKDGFWLFGETVSGLTNTILLALVYIFVFGATFVFGLFLKKNFVSKQRGWRDVNYEDNKDYFYRQF